MAEPAAPAASHGPADLPVLAPEAGAPRTLPGAAPPGMPGTAPGLSAPPAPAPPPANAVPPAAPALRAPPPAIRQLAPMVVALALVPGAEPALRVALEPPELGRVEIRIARGAEGGDAVRILAERPETLALLQRDRQELGRALDQAGVAAGAGGLSFGLAGQEGGGGAAPREGQGEGQGESQREGQREGQGRAAGTLAAPLPPRLPGRAGTGGLGLLDLAV